jgi:hypothetical protein
VKNNGGPAFPLERVAGSVNRGMAVRQWYKGMALAAIQIPDIDVGRLAAIAAAIADSMIAEDEEAAK